MKDLTIFNYQDTEVRTVLIDAEPWFVLADLTKVLGLTRGAAQVSERLDDALCQPHPIQDSLGRTQQATIVSESGLHLRILPANVIDSLLSDRSDSGGFTAAEKMTIQAFDMNDAMREMERRVRRQEVLSGI